MAETRKGTKKSNVDMGRLMRRVVADNVVQLMDDRFSVVPTTTGRWKALAMKAKVSTSTVERIVKLQIGASIDTLEDIAGALNVPPPVLFVPSERMREAMNVRLPVITESRRRR